MAQGERIIVCARGSTLRALVKYLDQIPDERIPGLKMQTRIPLVYELDANLTPLTRYYLGDYTAAREAQQKLIS